MKVPEGDFLSSRRRALEDSFFAERDRHLLDALRNELHQFEDRRQLAHVSSILDEKVLQDMVACGISGETLAALRLVPLVEVAWCDGIVSIEERQALLRAAEDAGIKKCSTCYELLARWLEEKPDPRLIQCWSEYIIELEKLMPTDSMQKLRHALFERLRTIAKAAGGLLGVHTISKVEHDRIEELVNTGLPPRSE